MQVLRGGQFRRNTAAEDVFDEDCLCCRQHELTKTSLLPRIKERAVGGGGGVEKRQYGMASWLNLLYVPDVDLTLLIHLLLHHFLIFFPNV